MTLREEIRESAFWHGRTCVRCGNTVEEEDLTAECPECGGVLVDSRELEELIHRSECEEGL